MYAPNKIIHDRLDFKLNPEIIPSLDYVVTYKWGKLIADLHRFLYDVFYREEREGWNWQLPQFTESAMSFALLRQIYFTAGEGETFKAIYRKARHKAKYTVVPFDATNLSVEFLYDLPERWHLFTSCFNNPRFINQLIEMLGGEFFLQEFAHKLTGDSVYATSTTQQLQSHVIHIELQRRCVGNALSEIAQRFKQFPKIVKHMVGVWQQTNDPRFSQWCWDSINRYLGQVAQKQKRKRKFYDKDEAVHKLWGLVQGRFEFLTNIDFRTQMVWIEENYEDLRHFPRRIKDRAINTRKKQQKENERVQSLEKPQGEEEIPIIEIVSANAQPVEPSEGIRVGHPLTTSQGEQIKKVLQSINGANPETGKAIVEYMTTNEVGAERGDYKQIANALGIAESTVGRYLGTRNRRGFINLIADELVGILRSR